MVATETKLYKHSKVHFHTSNHGKFTIKVIFTRIIDEGVDQTTLLPW